MNVAGVPEPELKELVMHANRTLALVDALLIETRSLLIHLLGIAGDVHALTAAAKVKVLGSDKG